MYQNQFQMTASLPMAQENKINPQLDFYIRKTMKEEFMTLILPYQQNSSGQIAILEEKIQMLNNNYMLLLKNNMDKTPQMGIGTNDSIEKLEKKINEISNTLEMHSKIIEFLQKNQNNLTNTNTQFVNQGLESQTQSTLKSFQMNLTSLENQITSMQTQITNNTNNLYKLNINELSNLKFNELKEFNTLKTELSNIKSEIYSIKSMHEQMAIQKPNKEQDIDGIPEEINNNNNSQLPDYLIEQLKQFDFEQLDPVKIEQNNKVILTQIENISRQIQQVNQMSNELKLKHDKEIQDIKSNIEQVKRNSNNVKLDFNPNTIQKMENKVDDFNSRLLSAEKSVSQCERVIKDVLTKAILDKEINKLTDENQNIKQSIEMLEHKIQNQNNNNDSNQEINMKINSLQKEVEKYDNYFTKLQNDVKVIEKDIQDINNKMNNNNNNKNNDYLYQDNKDYLTHNTYKQPSLVLSNNEDYKYKSNNENNTFKPTKSPFDLAGKDNEIDNQIVSDNKPSSKRMRTNLYDMLTDHNDIYKREPEPERKDTFDQLEIDDNKQEENDASADNFDDDDDEFDLEDLP